MSNFETKLKEQMEKAVLKIVSNGGFLISNYQDRVKIPPEFMADVWALVDVAKVKQQMAARIEQELANRIVNHMATELASDVKKILSVEERREALRAVARENINRICGDKPL